MALRRRQPRLAATLRGMSTGARDHQWWLESPPEPLDAACGPFAFQRAMPELVIERWATSANEHASTRRRLPPSEP